MADEVRIRGVVRSELVSLRTHARIMRDLLREVMTRHRDVTLPRHFQFSATTRYGYHKRSKGYQIHKARKYGHQRPLVYTGRLQQILATSKITATQYQARLYARSHFPLTPQRRAEIEIVLSEERAEMADWLARRYAEEIQKPGNRAKRIHRTR